MGWESNKCDREGDEDTKEIKERKNENKHSSCFSYVTYW
jgi:hypothetical protein